MAYAVCKLSYAVPVDRSDKSISFKDFLSSGTGAGKKVLAAAYSGSEWIMAVIIGDFLKQGIRSGQVCGRRSCDGQNRTGQGVAVNRALLDLICEAEKTRGE